MKTIRIAAFGAAAFLALAASGASAQTLYKLIDKDGKVTYSEKPPKDFDGKTIWSFDRNEELPTTDGKTIWSLRQHHDWQGPRLRIVLDGPAYFGARNIRQHQVENNQLRALLAH